MATSIPCKPPDRAAVGIGQAIFATEPTQLTTILGSCIALAMYSPQHRLGMLSHVVLPHAAGPTSSPAKFADTAVPHMISTLRSHGVRPGELVAKIAGGAGMFGDGKFMQIGNANVQTIVQALSAEGIRIAGQHVGGTMGRRVCFDLATGSVTVECIGHPSHTI
jgi:chemotaxis protein CheD